MSDIDLLPTSLDGRLRPDDPFALTLTWPAGTLAGRTFVATLGGALIDVAIVSNDMILSAPSAQTALLSGLVDLVLRELVAGELDTILAGKWSVTLSASSAPTTTNVVVIIEPLAVQVTVAPMAVPVESTLVDEAVWTSPSAPLAVNAFAMMAVPNTLITVPNLSRSVVFMGQARLAHSVANSETVLVIAPEGASPSGAGGRFGSVFLPTTAARATAFARGPALPANSPGDYRLWVTSTTAGNVTVDATANHATVLQAWAV